MDIFEAKNEQLGIRMRGEGKRERERERGVGREKLVGCWKNVVLLLFGSLFAFVLHYICLPCRMTPILSHLLLLARSLSLHTHHHHHPPTTHISSLSSSYILHSRHMTHLYIVSSSQFGASIIDAAASKLYTKKKADGKMVEKGVAFPVCVSVNDIICNLSPLASEELVSSRNSRS
jgi:hypothetical protein